MAKLFTTDGIEITVVPENGKNFTLKEMQMVVGGTIDILPTPSGTEEIVINDNGKLDGLPENVAASRWWQHQYPIAEFPINNDGLIVGNCLIGTPQEFGGEE
jgi:hypothetical protein